MWMCNVYCTISASSQMLHYYPHSLNNTISCIHYIPPDHPASIIRQSTITVNVYSDFIGLPNKIRLQEESSEQYNQEASVLTEIGHQVVEVCDQMYYHPSPTQQQIKHISCSWHTFNLFYKLSYDSWPLFRNRVLFEYGFCRYIMLSVTKR